MKIHIVQKGDTLFEIAKSYGVNFEEIVKLNSQLSSPDMIMPGMKIKIPSESKQVKSASDKATRVESIQQKAKTTERPIGQMEADDRVEPKEVPVKVPEEYEPISEVQPIAKPAKMPKQMKQESSEEMANKQTGKTVVKQEVKQMKKEGVPYRPVNEPISHMPMPMYHRPMSHCCCCCHGMRMQRHQQNPSFMQQRDTYYSNSNMPQRMDNQRMNNQFNQFSNHQMNYNTNYEMQGNQMGYQMPHSFHTNQTYGNNLNC